MRYVLGIQMIVYAIAKYFKDLSDDASDDTEEGMAQVNSSDDSDMDMDETETESLASSVAELSSGTTFCFQKNSTCGSSYDCVYVHICFRNQPEAAIGRPVRKSPKKFSYNESPI